MRPEPQPVEVILPCLDEGPALPGVLARLPAGYRAIVVDNGSTDGSAGIARAHGAMVVTEPRPGYGAAAHAGLIAASADIVCVLDCDGSVDPAELVRLVEPVRSRQADLVVGRRRPTQRAAWPRYARLGNALVAARLRRRTGLSVRDLGAVRVARREPLLELGVTDRRFGYPLELLVRAGAAGWRVLEADVAYRPRAAGTRSKVTGSLRGTLRTVRDFAAVLP